MIPIEEIEGVKAAHAYLGKSIPSDESATIYCEIEKLKRLKRCSEHYERIRRITGKKSRETFYMWNWQKKRKKSIVEKIVNVIRRRK